MIFFQFNIIRIGKQLEYFEQYQRRVSGLIGAAQTEQLVNSALILITLGGNDFVNNYYLVPFSARSRQFSLPDYVVYLISEYRKILQVIPLHLWKQIDFLFFLLINWATKILKSQYSRDIYIVIWWMLWLVGATNLLITTWSLRPLIWKCAFIWNKLCTTYPQQGPLHMRKFSISGGVRVFIERLKKIC